jgi:hypothetical protein
LPDRLKQRRLVAAIVAGATAVLVVGVYAFGWLPNLPYHGYQIMLRSMEIAGLALVLFFAGLAFTKSRAIQVCGLAAAISLGVAVDRSGIAALFRVYSFGRLSVEAAAVSHYDASDLNTMRWLRDHNRKSVVTSDPYTLGLAKAVAGVPGIYPFSNLDTVNQTIARQAKAVISALVEPTEGTKNLALDACAALYPLLANLNLETRAQIHASNMAQGIFKPVRPDELKAIPEITDEQQTAPKLEDILSSTEILNDVDGKWSVVVIVNPRTIAWLHLNSGQRLPYYPIDKPLEAGTLERLQKGPFPLLFTDGQNAVISIGCTRDRLQAGGRPP